MQAIVTKYLAPTNTRGARVKATAQSGSVIVSWDHAQDVLGNHTRAACALLNKLHWTEGQWHSGALPDDSGYAWVKEPTEKTAPGYTEEAAAYERRTRPAARDATCTVHHSVTR